MSTPESRRHEWQCNQGRGDAHDTMSAARGFVVWTIAGLSFWGVFMAVMVALA
jgi:hypothetical protein